MLWILIIKSTTRIPLRALIAVSGYPTRIFYDPGQVHQVPGHKRGVSIGEVVLRTAGAWIQIGRSRTRLT